MRFVLWALWMTTVAGLGVWVSQPTRPRPSMEAHPSAESTSLLGQRASQVRFRQHPCLKAPLSSLPDYLLEAEANGGGFEALLVLAHWFQVDREGLFAWLAPQRNRQASYAILAQWLVQMDLEAAWAEAGYEHTPWKSALIDALIKEDPVRAFAYLDHSRSDRFRDAMKSWAQRDFAGAVAATRSAKRWQKNRAVEGLAEAQFSRLSFEQAFLWAQGFDVLPEIAMGTVIDHLAKTDLESALRHLSESGISQARSMQHTQWALARLPLAEAMDLLARYPVRMDLIRLLEALPEDPTEAARLLAPVTREVERIHLYNWRPVTDDIAGSLQYLAGDPDNAAHRALLETSLDYWNLHRPEEVAAFIRDLPDPLSQATYAQEHGGRSLELLDLIDPEVLGEAFKESGIHHFNQSFVSLAHRDPRLAIAKAESLQNPSWRATAHEWIFKIWAEHEEAAAIDWAQSLPREDRQASGLEKLISTVQNRMP